MFSSKFFMLYAKNAIKMFKDFWAGRCLKTAEKGCGHGINTQEIGCWIQGQELLGAGHLLHNQQPKSWHKPWQVKIPFCGRWCSLHQNWLKKHGGDIVSAVESMRAKLSCPSLVSDTGFVSPSGSTKPAFSSSGYNSQKATHGRLLNHLYPNYDVVHDHGPRPVRGSHSHHGGIEVC